ncbi:MAG: DUF6508 domain-containing protein [Rhodospirillales bacterium]|nr:DUF6508 domain-containing protein [Rhodospirillales bacterium]
MTESDRASERRARERQPTARDIQALLAFKPILCADDFVPIREWVGGGKEDGAVVIPYPEYDQAVRDFVDTIVKDGWMDSGYVPAQVEKLIESERAIERATLPQMRAMLTYFVRGERFCDGWWGHMIEKGYIGRILERLAELEGELDDGRGRSRR